MNFKCGAENRACSRVSGTFFVFASVDVNRLDSNVHLTISSQNCRVAEGNEEIRKLSSHNGTTLEP
jgi:hypothetical protein